MTTAVETHYHVVGDTYTPITAQLMRDGEPFDVSGLTVQFKMVLASDNSVKVNWGTGSITDADEGKVQYDFGASDVDTAGSYYGWFRVGDGSEWDTWPKAGDSSNKARKWQIIITTAG